MARWSVSGGTGIGRSAKSSRTEVDCRMLAPCDRRRSARDDAAIEPVVQESAAQIAGRGRRHDDTPWSTSPRLSCSTRQRAPPMCAQRIDTRVAWRERAVAGDDRRRTLTVTVAELDSSTDLRSVECRVEYQIGSRRSRQASRGSSTSSDRRSPATASTASVSSSRDLGQQPLDLVLQRLDLGVDLLQRPRRHVLVEMPRQRDLVSDLGALVIDPGIRNVRQHLVPHVVIDGRPILQRREPLCRVLVERHRHRGQRHVLVVAQLGIRLGIALAVGDDRRLLIADGQRRPDGLLSRPGQTEAGQRRSREP